MFVRNVVYTFSLVNTVNAFKLCFITESQVHRQLLLAALSKKKKKKMVVAHYPSILQWYQALLLCVG